MKFKRLKVPKQFGEVWGAKAWPANFVISYLDEVFQASWKQNQLAPANFIGEGYQTWDEAEKACEDKLRELHQ